MNLCGRHNENFESATLHYAANCIRLILGGLTNYPNPCDPRRFRKDRILGPIEPHMPLFELSSTAIRGLERVDFGAVGLLERSDLQRLLRDHIDVIAPDTLVISEESPTGIEVIGESIFSVWTARRDWS